MIDIDNIPHILKYMGGKKEMLNDIHLALDAMEVNSDTFCDLFAGTSVVAYAMSDEYNLVVNDIQRYSEIFAKCYMNDYRTIRDINETVETIINSIHRYLEIDTAWPLNDNMRYDEGMDLEAMLNIENQEQKLIGREEERGFCLFKKCYSGTYWSYEQCRHIDAIRAICEQYKGTVLYDAMMAALIYAMSYSSQSTGHFAQYRTLTEKNYRDVLQYRLKDILQMFRRKLTELLTKLRYPHMHTLRASSLDYEDCIATLVPSTIVYADPPYSSVHYSRFYHVLETLVRYDNPKVEYKGRYRENRYQSPFDQRSKVKDAFRRLFQKIDQQQCHLLLSYSDNAMVSLKELQEIAQNVFGERYEYAFNSKNYQHMKMGRNDVARLDVHEILLSFKRI